MSRRRKRGRGGWLLALLLLLAAGGAYAWQELRPAPSGDATFRDLVDGKFSSGADKRGTSGVTVTVARVTVSAIRNEADGDWHLSASDPTFGPFILEIIPRDQAAVGKPPTGVPLTVRGVPYCDTDHDDAAWHGSTCWELHPVLAWTRE